MKRAKDVCCDMYLNGTSDGNCWKVEDGGMFRYRERRSGPEYASGMGIAGKPVLAWKERCSCACDGKAAPLSDLTGFFGDAVLVVTVFGYHFELCIQHPRYP